jgi:hypothetical protein
MDEDSRFGKAVGGIGKQKKDIIDQIITMNSKVRKVRSHFKD